MKTQNAKRKTQNFRFIDPLVKLIIGIYLYLGIWLLVIFPVGCAKTVTPLPVVGNQLNIEITFRGDIDTAKNSYYILLGSSSPAIPYSGVYFFAPGENYDINKMNIATDLNYYYKTYFSTWSDFISLKNNTFYIANGAFSSSESHSKYIPSFLAQYTSASSQKNKINLLFYFNRLSSLPPALYFNIAAVNESGYLKDFLRSSDNNISTNQGSQIFTVTEPEESNIDPALDIKSWSMVVQ